MLGAASVRTSAIAAPTPASTPPHGSPESAPETISDVSALVVLASVLTAVGAEPALPDGVQVQWTGAPGCPDASAVETRIASRLENREGPVRASVVIALVSTAEGGYGLSLDVELARETVHRELESSDCEVLVEATAVVVGIAVEPEIPVDTLRTATLVEDADTSGVPEAPPPSSPETEPKTEPEPKPTPKSGPAAEPPIADDDTPSESRDRDPLGGVVRLHGGGGVGVLPGVSGTAGLRVGVLGAHWRAELGADRTFRTDTTFPLEPGVGADFTMWSGTARGCYVPTHGRLEFPLCGGASAGLIRAAGFGGARNRTVRSWWVGAAVAPSLVWLPHPNVGLGASVDAFVAIWRPSFSGEERPQLLYTPAPVAARALGFVEFRWGS